MVEKDAVIERQHYKGLAWVASMALFMQSLDATILNTALPTIATALQTPVFEMQMAIIAYSLAVALFIPLTAWAAAKFGTLTVFRSAVFTFVFGSVACAMATSLETLVIARIIQGIGGAFMMPVARLAIIQTVPKNQLINAWNLMATAGLIGPILGPILGGWLVVHTSWHWIFLINIPIGMLGFWAAAKVMGNHKGNASKLDWTGFLLFAFGYLTPAELVAKDGLIANAFDGMLSSIIFILFIFVMVSLISEAGVLDAILVWMRKYAKSEKSAEIAAGAMVSVMGIVISSGTSAISFCGPIIRKLLRPFKIDRARAANFLDGLGCGVGYLVPTNPGCLNLAAIAVASGVVSEGYNAVSFVGYNFHSMALTLVFWFAILSGWGMKHETDEELAADGIVIEDGNSEK